MSAEDKKMARLLQRELTRHQSIDWAGTRVIVARSVATITGVIKPALGMTIRPKEETKNIMESIKRVPGLRDIVIEARWEV